MDIAGRRGAALSLADDSIYIGQVIAAQGWGWLRWLLQWVRWDLVEAAECRSRSQGKEKKKKKSHIGIYDSILWS